MGTRADNGELVGTFGDFGITSLYANKPITAGDGGWVHAREKKHLGYWTDPAYHFLHFETAPNAKMNGLGAAFVCSQVKMLPQLMQHRGHVASWYREGLAGIEGLSCIEQRQVDAPWVFGVETRDRKNRDALRDHLAAHGIETRSTLKTHALKNYFYPLHLEPVNFYGDDVGIYDVELPHSEHLAQVGFYLPTHSFLERAAALCSTLSTRLDKQVDLNETLYHRLRASEAEAHGLRIEMEELRRGEELRAEALASKEASVRAWEAGRLKELPKLQVEIREQFKSEAKAHHRELQQQASRRLATAERRFHEEVHDLESELNQARYENALMGRKCHGSYQATAQAEAALHQAHHQMNMMNQELTFLRAEHARVQEVVLQTLTGVTLFKARPRAFMASHFRKGLVEQSFRLPLNGFARVVVGKMSIKAETGGIPLDSSFQETLDSLTKSTNPDVILHGLRLVASQGELFGNQQGIAEVVARHLASSTPEVIAMAVRALGVLGEAGGHYADHVAAVMRWPNPEVRLAAVEVLGSGRETRKMFDFSNLDDIEDNGATPEWKKWQGIRWQREPEEELPVLIEESLAAVSVIFASTIVITVITIITFIINAIIMVTINVDSTAAGARRDLRGS
eukprot:s910_g10.t1